MVPSDRFVQNRVNSAEEHGRIGAPAGEGMNARTAPLAIDEVNRLDRAAFVAALGAACENSPWVVERSWDARPFRDVAALHAAIRRTIAAAPRDEKVAFLRAHPDLAGRAARAGEMTAHSVAEQSSAGLDRLSEDEYARFGRLNRAYREKFGFPFLFAVKGSTVATILSALERRLEAPPEDEFQEALAQVYRIASFRLRDAVHD